MYVALQYIAEATLGPDKAIVFSRGGGNSHAGKARRRARVDYGMGCEPPRRTQFPRLAVAFG